MRPNKLEDIVGQDGVVSCLKVSVNASKDRGDAMPHMLFEGPPGLGKTTLANALAKTREVRVINTNGGNIRSIKNILPCLMKLQPNDVLFIDEVHRIHKTVEEFLYPAMEDFRIDLSTEDEQISMDLPKFTMVGAPTLAGSLSRPFFDRFDRKFELKLYDEDVLRDILIKNADHLKMHITDQEASSMASRSRGTPRIAIHLIKWYRDYKESHNGTVENAMDMIGSYDGGFTDKDRKYLDFLKRVNRPVGLKSLADTLNLDKDTIMNIIEPFLLRKGLIQRTLRGRIVI